MKVLKTIAFGLMLSIVLVSCKDETSAQNYFVTHQDSPGFMQVDLGANLIDLTSLGFNEAQNKTVKSFKKINFIGYKIIDNDIAAYTIELEKVKQIFTNKKYNELINFSSNGMSVRVNTLGKNDVVKEVLLLVSSKEKSFGVARILGDDIKTDKIVELLVDLKKSEVNPNQFKNIMNFFN